MLIKDVNENVHMIFVFESIIVNLYDNKNVDVVKVVIVVNVTKVVQLYPKLFLINTLQIRYLTIFYHFYVVLGSNHLSFYNLF